MIPRLRTFGGLSIDSAHPLAGAATQRRPLAFLALLAIAGSRGITRDRAIALLWPESDAEHAQNSLSQVLSAVRRELADQVVTAAPVLRLNPDVIASDVAEFQERLDNRDLEGAVALYAGPFLDGFFIRNAPEFEHWVDQERSRLHHLQADALEHLARAAIEHTDHAAAVRWCRQRASLTPTDSSATRELMEALVAAGDLAGALEHFRIHQSLMRAELELEPDPALSEFALTLRADPRATSTRPNASGVISEEEPGDTDIASVTAEPPRAEPPRRRRRIDLLASAAFAVVFGVSAVAVLLWARATARLQEQLTYTGNAVLSSLSPDGKFLAYATESGDFQRVVVRDLTSDRADTVQSGPVVATLEWSPDGNWLLVGTGRKVLIVPRLGGPAREIGPHDVRNTYVYAYWVSGSRVSVHSTFQKHVTLLDTAKVGNAIVVPVGGAYNFLLEGSWSPDARHFAVTTESTDPVRFGISIVGLDTRRTEPLLEDSVSVHSPRWSPDGTIVYYARGSDELWRIRVDPRSGRPRGTPTRVQRDLHMLPNQFSITAFSITPDGRRLVYPRGSWFSNIYVVEPGPSDTAPPRGLGTIADLRSLVIARQLTDGTALRWSPRVSPDGRWIGFAEQTSGSAELFRVPIDGGPVQRLTFGARILPECEIAWSPDGKQIAFETMRSNHAQIWIADVDGHRMRGLEQTRVNFGGPGHLTWAPGGNIAYERYHHSIGLVDPVTGNERTLVSTDSTLRFYSPLYSPDGKRLAVTRLDSLGQGVWVFDLSKGTLTRVGDMVLWPRSWSPDGRYMYASSAGMSTVARIDATGNKPVQPYWVPPFRFAECTAAGARRPGAFVCVKFDLVSDISVINNFDR